MVIQLRYLSIFFLLLLCAGEAKADLYNSMKTFNSALLSLENRYVDTVDVDALTEVAIKAMLKELDPHSTYLSPKEVEQMNEGLGGSFEGIGVRYQMESVQRADGKIYDLTGREVQNITRPGIYIRNGRKFVVK